MTSKFCGKCGKVNEGQMNFCLQCGNTLTGSSPPSSGFQQPDITANQPVQDNLAPFPNNQFSGSVAPPPFEQNPGFQNTPPSFVQPNQFVPLAQTVEGQKRSGGKIISVLGVLGGGLLLFLKFGLVSLRLGGVGGMVIIGIGIVVFLAVIIINVIRRNR